MSKEFGFTGSSEPLQFAQAKKLGDVITRLKKLGYDTIHHGDCINADQQAHSFAVLEEMFTIAHPPENPIKRAFVNANVIRAVKPYLERNHDIVDETILLVAAPKTMTEVMRSGTWATIRYAHKKNRPIIYVYPDGQVINVGKVL